MKAAFSILAITSLLLSSCTLVELSDEDNYANLSVSGTANCYVVSQKESSILLSYPQKPLFSWTGPPN